ncbi:MAG: AraC family transcriptional regulator [Filimonas sp.]|nr:AraC family transcriptional regulator [Filimonas sp.]
MKNHTSLEDYCRYINVAAPLNTTVDIRRFEDIIGTLKRDMEPHRHEFYAIGMINRSKKMVVPMPPSEDPRILFFFSPYQVIDWNIDPEMRGYYLLFTEDFVRKSKIGNNILNDFPFLQLDKTVPFPASEEDIPCLQIIFEKIHLEYYSQKTDRFQMVQSYLSLLLLYVKRSFNHFAPESEAEARTNRIVDINLLSRFQTMIESSFYESMSRINTHAVGYYAQKLSVHPNYLNAVVKRITGKTAKQLIHRHILMQSTNLLKNSAMSIKEIGYHLHFDEPSHFNAFFKKQTGKTPNKYRDGLDL